MRRPILLLVAAAAVLSALYLVLSGGDPDTPVNLPESGDALPSGREVVAPDPAGDRATADREMVESVAEQAPDPGPPESYRKALCGVMGRLVEPDGTPVPDMPVEALAVTVEDFFAQVGSLFDDEPPTFNEVKGSTRSDDEGRFLFEGLQPRGIFALGIDLGGARATFRLVDDAPNPGELRDLGDVPLDPYVVFTGRVIDEQQNPVPGARVRATNLPSLIFTFGVQDIRPGFTVAFQEDLDGDWRVAPIPAWVSRVINRFPVPQTQTLEDGTFRLEGVPIGMVTVLVDKQDLVSLVHGPVPSGEGGERFIGDLRMSAGEVLIGRVVDAADEPVAGADIMTGPQLELAPAAVIGPAAVTDAEGNFRVKGLADVEHVVAARPQDDVAWTLATDVVPGFDEPTIRIGDKFFVTVIARDEAGEIIERPAVVVRPMDRMPLHPLLVAPISLAKRQSYRDDGAVIVTELDPGKYSILAKADGFAVGEAVADLTVGPTQVELFLVPELAGQVKVVAAGSNEPVEYALTGVFDPQAKRDNRMVPLVSRRTDRDGVAALPGLKAGSYKVAVFHPAFASAIADIEVPGPQVIVEMLQGGSIRGLVRSGNEPPAEKRFIALGPRRGENFPRLSVTDEAGEFEITHLEPGEYNLVVMRRFADKSIGEFFSGGFEQYMPEKFLEATVVEGEETFLDIDILGIEGDGPTATLRGRVIVNSAPGGDMTVQTTPEGSWRGMKTTRTDQSGNFDFGVVAAGGQRVTVQQKGRAGAFMFGRLGEQKIKLEPNEVRELRFEIRTGGVRGRVVLERDGSPVIAAEVSLRGEDSISDFTGTRLATPSERDGSFVFDQVPAGTYRLRVKKENYADAVVQDIKVPFGGEPAPLVVRLTTGESVRGRVELSAGEQPRFVFVSFRNEANRDIRGGDRVDPTSMEFAMDGLVPGRYEVTVYAGQNRFEKLFVDVPAGGLEGCVLRPQPVEDG